MVRKLFNPTTEIRTATPADFSFIRSLQKRFTNQIGFIPDQATNWYIEAGRVMLALENGEPAGMLLGREAFRWNISFRPIFQAAIQFDAQRRQHGLSLVELVAADAREAGQVALQCCCREGLDANGFWKAAGFEEICRLDPASKRKKQIIVWRKKLIAGFTPPTFYVPPPVAGHKARRAQEA